VITSTKQSSEGPLRPKTCQRAQSHNSALPVIRTVDQFGRQCAGKPPFRS
jgi:hypothetical protein